MDQKQLEDLPNPFALDIRQRQPSFKPLLSSAKVLLATSVLLALLTVTANWLGDQNQKRLQHSFPAMSVEEKKEHLAKIDPQNLSAATMPLLAQAFADKDDSVAVMAYQILRDHQNHWHVSTSSESDHLQGTLVRCLDEVSGSLPESRQGLAQSLINTTITATVDQSDIQSRRAYFSATSVLDKLASDKTAQDTIPTPDRITMPLPIGQTLRQTQWTDWPPSPSVVQAEYVAETSSQPEPISSLPSPPSAPPAVVKASHRAPLSTVGHDEPIVLQEVTTPHQANDLPLVETAYRQPAKIEQTVQLLDSKLAAFSLTQVIGLLGSVNEDDAQKARAELQQRGLNESEIRIANTISSANRDAKLQLIETLPNQDQQDPRAWLLMLLNDHDREIKLRTVTALAELKDPWVRSQLRIHMVDEKDQAVAFRIRRALNLR